MNDDFHRIRRLPPYVFAHIDPIKAKLRASGVDIIDLGMGNPDMPTPAHIVEKLKETVKDPRTHRYSSSRGIPGLRKAQASYYGRRFGVKLNPDTQIVATLGSKEGFANMASAITAPGDVVLVPNPTYPIHSFGFIMSGGVVRSMPADPNEDFMRSLDRAVRHSIPKPIALVLNYPANPTAYTATLDFYKEVVAYCKAHNIFILSDLAYSEIYFDGVVPPSVLEVPGAIDITVEFTSMSKTYSMPGWRVGFAVGNERLIAALARVKSYLDYGAFTPDPGGRRRRPQRRRLGDFGSARHLPEPSRRDGRELRPGRLEAAVAQGHDVRLVADSGSVRRHGVARVRQAADPGNRRRRRPGRRLRRIRRPIRASRAGRERAAHPPGGPQHQEVPRRQAEPRQRGAADGEQIGPDRPRGVHGRYPARSY